MVRERSRSSLGMWAEVFFMLSSSLAVSRASGEKTSKLFPGLIVFGDSTVEVGMNTYYPTIVRSNFAPYGRAYQGGKSTGRFTDGRTATDFLAETLGLRNSQIPYLHPNATGEQILQGVNFASGGSGYLKSTSLVLNVIPAFEQFQMFLKYKTKISDLIGQEKAISFFSEALYFISAGSNDFILNYLPINSVIKERYSRTDWANFVFSNQTEFVKQLYFQGGRNVLLFGFPPIGCLPAQITLFGSVEQKGCVEDLNQLSVAYNNRLKAAIPKLESNLPGLRLLYGDAYSYIYEAFNNPSKYGYTQTRIGCCGAGLIATVEFCNALSVGTCSDSSTYMFFDSLHPTESVYKAIAKSFINEIVTYFGDSKN